MEFRLLRADEIDCRIASCNQWGVQLLLYKDARCDQNILDETVGCMNWQRHHTRDNANCIVSIWDSEKQQWIEKEDTGTESNTEKEKGLASDSFKRACFNWGIGRELYTSPAMFVRPEDLKTLEQYNGKWTCKDTFRVTSITYDGRCRIVGVEIINTKTRKTLKFGDNAPQAVNTTPTPQKASEAQITVIKDLCNKYGVNLDAWLAQMRITIDTINPETAGRMLARLKELENGSQGKNQ